MATKVMFWSLTFILCSLCTLTFSEVIEPGAPKDSVAAIDSKNEAPYSAVGKEDSGSDVINSDEETTTESLTSPPTTAEPVRSYRCREYGYCQATLFPYEVILEGHDWTKTIFCQQGVNPREHCCLPVTQHFVCYNITVKHEGHLSLAAKDETDFNALCREMLKTQNHTMSRYSFVTKTQGSADVVFRHDTWWNVDADDSYFIEDLACEYYVAERKKEGKDDVTEGATVVTTETPEEEEEEEEEDEDEEEREKKEREREEEEGGGDGGGGSERERKGEEEEEEEEEEKEEEREEEQEKPKKKKKKGRRN